MKHVTPTVSENLTQFSVPEWDEGSAEVDRERKAGCFRAVVRSGSSKTDDWVANNVSTLITFSVDF